MTHLWILLQIMMMLILPRRCLYLQSWNHYSIEVAKRDSHIPQSRQDVSLQGEGENTLSDEWFLLCDDGDTDKLILFATSKNLKLLSEASNINADGTFEIRFKIYYQLFTHHFQQRQGQCKTECSRSLRNHCQLQVYRSSNLNK